MVVAMPIELNDDGSFPQWQDEFGRRHPTQPVVDLLEGGDGGGGPHTHPESDVTNLTNDLAGKAASGHNHDASYAPTHSHPYAATSHGHAQADVTNLVSDLSGKAASGHNHSGTYEPAGTVATHAAAGDPHPGYLTAAEGNAAYATVGHSHGGGGGEAFPVGSVFIAVVSTDPATLLGYGTWARLAQGRMLVGQDSGDTDFDTAKETGGAKTVTLTTAEMPAHTHTQDAHGHTQNSHNHTQDAHNHTQNAHVHDEFNNSATTGGLVGWGAQDTSTNTASLTGYDTGSTTATNIAATATNQAATATNQNATATNQSTGGGGAHQNMPPYLVAYIWERTA